ncbi:MAG: filamentous hemagglutinin N-terminal domain-containing protein, partial [Rhodospirillales bacterium]|nr:filamentous hemagglutinin N-terminal domain-containing protein [Rhodospirillales bacterium]
MVETGRHSVRDGSQKQGSLRHHGLDTCRAPLLRSTALQAVALAAMGLPAMLTGARAQVLPAPTQLPTGGQVIAGQAGIATNGATMQVTQGTNQAAVNWQSFSVGSQATVKFAVPNSNSMTINRVVGPDPSVIAGRVSSNGQVVLTNQSGVTFTQGAQVDVQSLIVSAPGITEANAKAGRLVFDQPARAGASVVNQGTITVAQTGLAALVAPQVANSGVIRAQLGRVVLAGAAAHTVDLYGDGLLSIDVTKQVTTVPVGPDGKPVTVLVTNSGTILADGGTVVLTASAVDGLVQTLVDSGGTVSAATVGSRVGRIAIGGTGGDVVVQGTVATRGEAAGTMGGQIEVNAPGHTMTLATGAKFDASGRAGGGLVAVGTTVARAKAGPGTAAPTARNVMIAKGVTVAADALDRGHGGNVTVLSSGGSTVHQGSLSARGGAAGGDGGAVELSGDYLALLGVVNVLAPMGLPGSILFDPSSINIVTDGTAKNTVLTNPFDANKTTTTLDYTQINQLSGNVTLQATGTIAMTGAMDLTAKDAGGNAPHVTGLTLLANDNITIGAALTGASNITLSAGATYVDGASKTQTGLSTAVLTINAAVTSTGGAGTTISLASADGGIHINAPVSDAGGALNLSASGGGVFQVAGAGVITTASLTGSVTGNVKLTSTLSNAIGAIGDFKVNTGTFTLSSTAAVDVTGTLAASSVTLSSSAAAAALTVTGEVDAVTSAALTTTLGSINITGKVSGPASVVLNGASGISETGVLIAGTLSGGSKGGGASL